MSWIAATLIASVLQTGRNAAQAGLTGQVGTMGATAVRFIFGLPFALMTLLVMACFVPLPIPGGASVLWTAFGAGAQIAATAFMLITMQGRGFGVATALMKTEPVTLALIGWLVLSEPLGIGRLGAIATATLGVILTSSADFSRAGLRGIATGIIAGALFGLSAIGFRGALLAMPDGAFFTRAAVILALSLAMQAAVSLIWLGLADRPTLRAIMAAWRVSWAAGAMGAFASLFWFIGFALTSAANVRTLALIEVVFAQVLSGRLFKQSASARQLLGMGLIVLGVGWLLWVA